MYLRLVLLMYFQPLYPFPKSCVENRDVRFVFGASVQAVISGLDTECVKRVKALWNRFSATASELNVVSADNGFQLVIGGASAVLAENDSYAIHADDSGVCVVGRDAQALMNGIMSLMQLICPDVLDEGRESLYINAVDIHDAPAMPFRAIHLCLFGGTKLWKTSGTI